MTSSTAKRATPQTYVARSTLRFIILAVALVIVLFPLALMFVSALKSQGEIFSNPFGLPAQADWTNFARAWNIGGIADRATNSAIVTIVSVLISTVFGAGAGYVCARIRPRSIGNALTILFAFGLFIPVQAALVPLFTEMQSLGLLGTLAPIILVDSAMQLPLSVVIFAAFFSALPLEIEESASVDGASRIRVLRSIVIPLARPAIATSVILGAVAVWNDYFVALIFSTDPSIQTLPVGLAAFKSNFATDWPGSLAYSAIIALPVFVLYIALQRYITDGVTAGAVRG